MIRNSLCLEVDALDSLQGGEDLVKRIQIQRQASRVDVVKAESKEPLFHLWPLEELLRHRHRVDLPGKVRRLSLGLFFQPFHTLQEGRIGKSVIRYLNLGEG